MVFTRGTVDFSYHVWTNVRVERGIYGGITMYIIVYIRGGFIVLPLVHTFKKTSKMLK